MHFDLVDIRLFINIAETNSLTRGAERSNLSLTSASKRIKNFEESLGIKVLYRTSQGVALTPPGQAFLHHARLVRQQLEQLRGDLQQYVSGTKGHVRMFANATAITEFLTDVLPDFLARHPDIDIDLRERLSPDIVRAVSDGKTDIGIVAGYVRTEELEVFPYREDRLVLVTPPDHPLAGKEEVDFAETLDYGHIGLPESSALHAFLTEAAHGLHRSLKIRIQVGNCDSVCRMIGAKTGIAVLPQSAAQRHAQSMPLRLIPLTDHWAFRKLHIVVRNRQLLPSFSRELIDLLAAHAARDF
jgi:DNA-binding transcriptional LysR family regulator